MARPYKKRTEPTEISVSSSTESQKIEPGIEKPYFSLSFRQETEGWTAEVLLIQGDKVEKRYRKDPDLRAIAQHDFLKYVALLTSQPDVLQALFQTSDPH